MYIVVNRISAPKDQTQAMIEAFKHAVPSMKRFSGFLGFELWTADDGTINTVSRWTSRDALEEYLQNDLFRQHHSGTSSEQMNISNQVSYYSAEVLS